MSHQHYGPGHEYGGYYQPAPPPRQRSNNCLLMVVMGGIVALTGILVCLGTAVFLGGPIAAILDGIIAEMTPPARTPTAVVSNGTGDIVEGSGSVSISSHQVGVVRSPGGARLDIPPSAVPVNDSGDSGSMVFSIEEDSQTTATLPVGFSAVGPLYHLGPQGFNFNQPVILSLPIPSGVDVDSVVGLAYYDSAESEWKLVPGAVSPEDRTVSAATVHFSPWTIARTEQTRWLRQNGGWVTVVNHHLYDTDITRRLPDVRLNRYSVTYGICVTAFTPDDPAVSGWWTPPNDWIMSVSDYYRPYGAFQRPPPGIWWLPAGSYQLLEVVFVSEINPGNPLYVPRYGNSWRSWGVLRVEPDSQNRFERAVFVESEDWPAWTQERPPCFGVQTTSVGTGDVQITLTWNSRDDLDLHVVDPFGDKVYYGNTVVRSGGQLDRDNLCNNMVVGRPENIFWPSGSAPSGTYEVYVNYFAACEQVRPVNFTVRVVVSGRTQTFNGHVTYEGETQQVTTFTVR